MSIKLPEISVIIIGDNTRKYLDSCLKAIRHQTIYNKNDIEVIFLDNASFDGSLLEIQRNYRWVSTVRNTKKVSIPAAINQALRYTSGDFVLILNPDITIEPDYLEKAAAKMKEDSQIAAVGGKIYQYDFNLSKKTAIFNTVGIFAMVDREILSARGVQDMGQFEDEQDILSIRNICGMYRRRALEDARVYGEYFDEEFKFFLADIDMCWRLHLLAWRVCFVPGLVAYRATDLKTATGKKAYRKRERRSFIKNDRLMLIKNEFAMTMLSDWFTIAKKRFTKKSFLREGWIFGWFVYAKQIPSALRKRWFINKRRRIARLEMRRWFIKKSGLRYNYYKSKSLEIYAKYPPVY